MSDSAPDTAPPTVPSDPPALAADGSRYAVCNFAQEGAFCRLRANHDGEHQFLRTHRCCNCISQKPPLPCCNVGHDTGWVTLDGYAARDPAGYSKCPTCDGTGMVSDAT